jgi:CRISPR-associated exonuclease Cas4
MYADEDLLPISALQHLLFCERQCALIHVERLWAEDRRTAEGRALHDKAHGKGRGSRGGGLASTRGGVRTVRAMPLRSLKLGLYGVADVVEFRRDGPPTPVEYKRGRSKKGDMDRVQVCAQAMCLEEMLGVEIPEGALFYAATRRREAVPLTDDLRKATRDAIDRFRALVAAGECPSAVYEKKCKRCSLINLCLPASTDGSRSAQRYVRRTLAAMLAADDSLAGGPEGPEA